MKITNGFTNALFLRFFFCRLLLCVEQDFKAVCLLRVKAQNEFGKDLLGTAFIADISSDSSQSLPAVSSGS